MWSATTTVSQRVTHQSEWRRCSLVHLARGVGSSAPSGGSRWWVGRSFHSHSVHIFMFVLFKFLALHRALDTREGCHWWARLCIAVSLSRDLYWSRKKDNSERLWNRDYLYKPVQIFCFFSISHKTIEHGNRPLSPTCPCWSDATSALVPPACIWPVSL